MLDPGIIDKDVEPAKVGLRFCDHLGDAVRSAHVGRRMDGPDMILCNDVVPGLRDVRLRAKAVQHDM
jgi:hypothetical protein